MKKQTNKTAFVLSLPATMPAKEVVAAAKKKGITLTTHYAHVIRSNAKRKTNGRRGGAPQLAEKQMRAAMADIGLERSRQILAALTEEFR